MKKFLLLALICVSTSYAFPQTDNYRADLDVLFGALDKTKASTGYLAPYGIDAIDKDDFNGILADSNNILPFFNLMTYVNNFSFYTA